MIDRLRAHRARGPRTWLEEVWLLGETEKERVDRELIELLNELRVVLPGVQVLFAFLLLLPFQQTFAQVSVLERDIYFVAFAATAAASIMLIAPSTYHRIRFRDGDKERMLRTSNRMLLAGTALLGCAIATVAFLVADVLFGELVGAMAAGVTGVVVAWVWYGLPLSRKARDDALGRGQEPTGPRVR